MKKARLIAGMTAAIPAAAGGFAVHAATHATTASADQVPVKGKTMYHGIQLAATGPQWASLSFGETLHFRNGGTGFPRGVGWRRDCLDPGAVRHGAGERP